jgi:hypothetical protein
MTTKMVKLDETTNLKPEKTNTDLPNPAMLPFLNKEVKIDTNQF